MVNANVFIIAANRPLHGQTYEQCSHRPMQYFIVGIENPTINFLFVHSKCLLPKLAAGLSFALSPLMKNEQINATFIRCTYKHHFHRQRQQWIESIYRRIAIDTVIDFDSSTNAKPALICWFPHRPTSESELMIRQRWNWTNVAHIAHRPPSYTITWNLFLHIRNVCMTTRNVAAQYLGARSMWENEWK